MPLCPNCWTGVEALTGDCPACGARLGASPRGPRRWLGAAAFSVLALATLGIVLATWEGGPTEDGTEPGAAPPRDRTASDGGPPVDRPDAGTSTAATPETAAAHWRWSTESAREVTPLVIETASGPRLAMLLPDLPTRGAPTWRSRPLEIAVVHVDPWSGLVLLEARTEPPTDVTAVRIEAANDVRAGAELTALAPDGGRSPVTVAARRADGRLELARPGSRGAALVDAAGLAVAIVTQDREAVPLDPLLPWLDAPAGRGLADLQAELRRQNPALVLEDLERLIGAEPSIRELREAIDRAAAAGLRAGDRQLIEALTRAELDAHRLLIRRLVANQDNAEALSVARNALARHPADPGLLEDASLLAAVEGDVAEVSLWFGRLRGLAGPRADAIADRIADALKDRAARWSTADRATEALAAIDQARLVAPRRADLLADRAETLRQLGRLEEAVASAREAAAVDPAHAALAAELAEALSRSRDPTIVEIPFDPRTHVIRTDVRAGGLPLSLVVDTGATTTTIPVAVADRLGLRSPTNRRVQVQTAGGIVEGELVELPSLMVGRMELRAVEAVAMDLPGTLAGSGLLGMNALSRFRVEIDSARGVLVLHPR